jgi:dihydrofolate reductase
MGKVVIDITMSLDGFIAAPGDVPDVPLGEGGHRLHDWLAGDRTEVESKMMEESHSSLAAIISGRRNYDNSEPWWGKGEGPAGDVPVFVVSHRPPPEGIGGEGSVFTFSDNLDDALKLAQEAAGEGDVCIMGGADIAQQYLKAGLVDEVSIHLVPVLLGAGRRLFDNLGTDHIELEPVDVVSSATTTHLQYRVVR